MQAAKKLAALGCATIVMYMLAVSGAGERIGQAVLERLGDSTMKNVVVVSSDLKRAPTASALSLSVTEPVQRPEETEAPKQTELSLPEMELMYPSEAAEEPEIGEDQEIMETTIDGGLTINNATQYWVDAARE